MKLIAFVDILTLIIRSERQLPKSFSFKRYWMSNMVTKFAYRILVTCLGTIFSITTDDNFYISLDLVEGWAYIRFVENIGNWLLARLCFFESKLRKIFNMSIRLVSISCPVDYMYVGETCFFLDVSRHFQTNSTYLSSTIFGSLIASPGLKLFPSSFALTLRLPRWKWQKKFTSNFSANGCPSFMRFWADVELDFLYRSGSSVSRIYFRFRR